MRRCLEIGDIIERAAGGKPTRGLVVSNERDGLYIMSTTGWHMAIPSTHVRILSAEDGDVYEETKRKSERHWKRFLKG